MHLPERHGAEMSTVAAWEGAGQTRDSKFTFKAIGTQWEIETQRPLGRSLGSRILSRIECFEGVYSRFRQDSLVARIPVARDGGSYEFPNDSIRLFDLYDQLHTASFGSVDPLVGRDLELLGYDRTYSLQPASAEMRAAAIADGRPVWSQDVVRLGVTIVTRRPLVIDVGAVGKGYLVDIASCMLRRSGVDQFLVDGSGDMRHTG